MMSNIICTINEKDFDSMYEIMKDAFDHSERRTYEKQKELFRDEKYHVIGYTEDGKVNAFLAWWEFDEFIFIEHFAVRKELRGKGLGTSLFKKITDDFLKYIILEVKHPSDEEGKDQINFYKKLGMMLNPFEYVQPAVNSNTPELDLMLMSYGKRLSSSAFNYIKETLYKEIYHKKI